MSNLSFSIWQNLANAGIVSGLEPKTNESLDSPWYIKFLLGFSGWIAALFLLGSIGMAFDILREPEIAFITGVLMIAAAYYLMNVAKNEFTEHLGLAISLAGQILITFSIFDKFSPNKIVWYLISIYQTILVFLIPNFIHRIFSTAIAAFCLEIGLISSGMPIISSNLILALIAWVWLYEFKNPKAIMTHRAIGYGLIFSFFLSYFLYVLGAHPETWASDSQLTAILTPWMGETLTSIILLYVTYIILKRLDIEMTSPISIFLFLGVVALTFVSMEAYGITISILILLLGFSSSNKVLMGLGIVSLLFFISDYYYLLNQTLLEKSFTLFITGIILLFIRFLLIVLATNKGNAT